MIEHSYEGQVRVSHPDRRRFQPSDVSGLMSDVAALTDRPIDTEPTFLRDVHLAAERQPHRAGRLSLVQCSSGGAAAEAVQGVAVDQHAAVAAAELVVDQLPELAHAHPHSVARCGRCAEPRRPYFATMKLITAQQVPPSLARVDQPTTDATDPVRVGLVQHHWRADADALREALRGGIEQAAEAGARVVFLPELTLSKYPADVLPEGDADRAAEDLLAGPTFEFAAAAAKDFDVHVHASLFEKAPGDDGRGLNTAILVSPSGELVARTRKTHIPVTAGYYEDKYFRPGPAQDAYPVVTLDDPAVKLGMPTCWDEWFPEVARSYALGGAQLLAYPTAIGSEPDHPEFDTQPLWQHTIVGHAIANGLFVVVPNRTGNEGLNTFYGSSFIADPYGRVLVQAPRDEEVVLVADLDLAQGKDWIDLFPFLATRRPDTYAALAEPVRPEHVREDPNP